jgi:GWxTD domain-containing protein
MTAHGRILTAAMIISALATMSAHSQVDESRPQQSPLDNRTLRLQDDLVSFEPFYRSAAGDSSTVDVLFRFRRDFLIFQQSMQTRGYSAEAEVTIEILDSTGNSIARNIKTYSLSSEDNSQAFLKRSYEQGLFTFHLRRGQYSALCIISDKEAEHKQFARRVPIRTPRMRVASSSLLLALAVDSASGILPCNLGGNAFFDSPLYAVFTLPSRYATMKAVYSLDRIRMEGEDKHAVVNDTAVALTLYHRTALAPSTDSAGEVFYRFVPDTTRSVAVLSLNGEKLAQGHYMLRLKLDAGDTTTLMSNFALTWIDMPQSLRDLDFATTAMKYITTDEEYDNLTNGRRTKRIEAFDEFWKKLDPTPGTAYNERLAEYFRRVDYAYQNFRTLKEENGVLTDRGRIYILYGKPAQTERLLSPSNSPREVWRYPAIKKLFTFEDPSRQGNYKLIQTDTQ